MALIDDTTKERLRERLAGLPATVELKLYRKPDTGRLILPPGHGCATCNAAEELVTTIAECAPERITLEVRELDESEDASAGAPSITISAPGEDPRITFQGLPAGYEFATLLDAIERVSAADPELSPEATAKLAGLDEDVEIMVFVTPTCQYCPSAASMANRMAVSSPKVRSRVVEANEFVDLSQRFQVQGVPRTVVNRGGSFVGALPEAMFVDSVLELASAKAG